MPVPCPLVSFKSPSNSYFLALSTLLALSLASSAQANWLDMVLPKPTEQVQFKASIAGETKLIQMAVFLPSERHRLAPRMPAVVLLHGVEGAKRYELVHYQTAARLSRDGYAVFFVHYFDSVDYKDLYILDAAKQLDTKAIEAHCALDSKKWQQAILSAVQEIARRDDIDRDALAVNGYSLGGFLALATTAACREDQRGPQIKSVVVNWGAKFADTKLDAGFPPTFFVHGQRDCIVPLTLAETAVARLREVKSDTTLHVIAGGGHTAFTPESLALTRDFLRKHLVKQPCQTRESQPPRAPEFSLAR
jgi:dienelactone hydrolase